MNIVMLLSNPFRPDPRVLKEASSLTKNGYKVSILCWDRRSEFPPEEVYEGITIRRIAIPSNYASGPQQVLHLPRFWYQALKIANDLKPDILHCHDLDTTPIGYLYSRRKNIPWIYDAHECYPEQMRQQAGRLLYQLLLRLDNFMAKRAGKMITINELLARHFRTLGGRVSIVGNYQPIGGKQPLLISRSEAGIREEAYLVAYIGGFTSARAILPLIHATDIYKDATVLLVGDGSQREQVESELSSYPHVRYTGWIPQAEIGSYFHLADTIYYGLYAASGNSRFSSPNALFQAMKFGKPIITTDLGEIADIVRAEKCGIVIDKPTASQIAQAIQILSDENERQRLGENGRRAAERKYNWEVSEISLLGVYQDLLSKQN